MPELIKAPTRIPSVGTKPKTIDEHVGRVNTGDESLSIAHMRSPQGWREPGQRPAFREYTVVLAGRLHVEYEGGSLTAAAGQTVLAQPGEWVRYSTPDDGGAEYIAVCAPAFSPDAVDRDPE